MEKIFDFDILDLDLEKESQRFLGAVFQKYKEAFREVILAPDYEMEKEDAKKFLKELFGSPKDARLAIGNLLFFAILSGIWAPKMEAITDAESNDFIEINSEPYDDDVQEIFFKIPEKLLIKSKDGSKVLSLNFSLRDNFWE